MTRPAAVQRQIKEAQRLQEALRANPNQIPEGAEVAKPDPNVLHQTPADVPPAAPADAAKPNSGTTEKPSSEAPAAAPEAQPAADDPKWESRYKALQGKYNKEVPELVNSVRALRATVEQQNTVLTQLRTQPQQAQEAPAPAAKSSITDDERREFGDDLIDVMGRRAREAVAPDIEKMRRDQEEIKQHLVNAAAREAAQARNAVWQALDANIPEWRGVNDSDAFLAWLEGRDIFSGGSRRNALTAAFNANEAERVVGIFQAFLKEDSANLPTPRTATVDKGTLVAPGTPRGGSAEAPMTAAGKRIWSEREINDFYHRSTKKRVFSQPERDEYNRTQAEIMQAVKEGRVRPSRPGIHLNEG